MGTRSFSQIYVLFCWWKKSVAAVFPHNNARWPLERQPQTPEIIGQFTPRRLCQTTKTYAKLRSSSKTPSWEKFPFFAKQFERFNKEGLQEFYSIRRHFGGGARLQDVSKLGERPNPFCVVVDEEKRRGGKLFNVSTFYLSLFVCFEDSKLKNAGVSQKEMSPPDSRNE